MVRRALDRYFDALQLETVKLGCLFSRPGIPSLHNKNPKLVMVFANLRVHPAKFAKTFSDRKTDLGPRGAQNLVSNFNFALIGQYKSCKGAKGR